MPNPYLYNRDQKDLQTLQSVLGLMDYFDKRKTLKKRESAIGSLEPGLQKYYQLTGEFPTTDKPNALARALGIDMPEEPDKERPKYLQGLTSEELPFAATQEEAGGSAFTSEGIFAPEQAQGAFSTPEKISVVPKLGIATAPKEPSTYAPTEPDKARNILRNPKQHTPDEIKAARISLGLEPKTDEGMKPWDAQTYRQEKAKFIAGKTQAGRSILPDQQRKLTLQFYKATREINPAVADSLASQDLGFPQGRITAFSAFPDFATIQKWLNSQLKSGVISSQQKQEAEKDARLWFGVR